jgi:Mg2+/Co2+ transporter CorB
MGSELLLFLAASALTALSSGSETAFSAASRIRALGRARGGSAGARRASRLMARSDLYLTTTLVGTNVGTVLASSLAARMASHLDAGWAVPAAALLTTLFLLVLAEVVPKQLGFVWRDRVVDLLSTPVLAMRVLFYPLVAAAGAVPKMILKKRPASRFFESREEVRSLLVGEGEAAGREAAKVLRLGSATAGDIARPLGSYPSISVDESRQSVVEEILGSGSEFLAVFEHDRRLLGMVRSADILRHTGEWDLAGMTEGLPYFDRRTILGKALHGLKRAGAHAGVVLGADGQPIGLLDADSVMDAVIGEGGEGPAPRSGTIRWRDGRASFLACPVADPGEP